MPVNESPEKYESDRAPFELGPNASLADLARVVSQDAVQVVGGFPAAFRTLTEFDKVDLGNAPPSGQRGSSTPGLEPESAQSRHVELRFRRVVRRPDGSVFDVSHAAASLAPMVHEVRVPLDYVEGAWRIGQFASGRLPDPSLLAIAQQSTVIPTAHAVMDTVERFAPGLAHTLRVRQIEAQRIGPALCQLTVSYRGGAADAEKVELVARLDRVAGNLELATHQGNIRAKAPLTTTPDGTVLPARRETLLALSAALGQVVAEDKGYPSGDSPQATDAPDQNRRYVRESGTLTLTASGYRDAAALVRLHELLPMASLRGKPHRELRKRLHTLIDELGLRAGGSGVDERRAAVYSAIPAARRVVKVQGGRWRRHTPAVLDGPVRRASTQVLLDTMTTAAYLPALPSSSAVYDVRAVAGMATTGVLGGIKDAGVVNGFARRDADWVSPRGLLERRSVVSRAGWHGAAGLAEAAIRTGAAVLVAELTHGVNDWPWLMGSAARGAVTWAGTGVADGLTYDRVLPGDIRRRAKEVVRRGEAVDIYERLERQSDQWHRAVLLATSDGARVDPHATDELLTALREHEHTISTAWRGLNYESHADSRFELAKLVTRAAPVEETTKQRLVRRIGPKGAAAFAGMAVSAGLRGPALATLQISPLVQAIWHGVYARKTRHDVAEDDGAVARGSVRRRQMAAQLRRADVRARLARVGRRRRRKVTTASAATRLEEMRLDKKVLTGRAPRPWPYVLRGIKASVFSGLSTLPAYFFADSHPYALANTETTILGSILTGIYWECDRQLAHRSSRKNEELSAQIAAEEIQPELSTEFTIWIQEVIKELRVLDKKLLTLTQRITRVSDDRTRQEKWQAEPLRVSLSEVWDAVLAQNSLVLAERFAADLDHAVTAAAPTGDASVAVDAYIRELLDDYDRIKPEALPAKIASALRHRHEADIAAIATAEVAWAHANEHLPRHFQLAQLYSDEKLRVPSNREYLRLCQAVAALPSAKQVDGRATAWMLASAFAGQPHEGDVGGSNGHQRGLTGGFVEFRSTKPPVKHTMPSG